MEGREDPNVVTGHIWYTYLHCNVPKNRKWNVSRSSWWSHSGNRLREGTFPKSQVIRSRTCSLLFLVQCPSPYIRLEGRHSDNTLFFRGARIFLLIIDLILFWNSYVRKMNFCSIYLFSHFFMPAKIHGYYFTFCGIIQYYITYCTNSSFGH